MSPSLGAVEKERQRQQIVGRRLIGFDIPLFNELKGGGGGGRGRFGPREPQTHMQMRCGRYEYKVLAVKRDCYEYSLPLSLPCGSLCLCTEEEKK